MPAPRKKTAPKRRAAKPARKTTRSHLLIIECDTKTLARDGLHVGTGFSKIVKASLPDKRIAIVQTSTKDQMQKDLAKVFTEFGRFRSILIVGHSDDKALDMTADFSPPWAEVGKWIEIFEPEFLFLAACEAGQSKAVRDVFKGAGPSLRQIYACPVLLHKIHTAPMGVLIYMQLTQGKINPEQSEALRAAHYVLSGGQLYRWRRNETGPGEDLHGKLWDAIGKTIYFGEWDLLKKLFPNS
jgi:hypothetical protein